MLLTVLLVNSTTLTSVYDNNMNKVDFEPLQASYLNCQLIKDLIIYTKRAEVPHSFEGEYTRLMSVLLPYYCKFDNWYITPEYNFRETIHPDYTVFRNIGLPDQEPKGYVIVETISRSGASWFKLLEQLRTQADVGSTNGRVWVISQKGFEICIFRFDRLSYPNEGHFTSFEPVNVDNYDKDDRDHIEVKYLKYINRIAVIKCRLDKFDHAYHIDRMFIHILSNNA